MKGGGKAGQADHEREHGRTVVIRPGLERRGWLRNAVGLAVSPQAPDWKITTRSPMASVQSKLRRRC